jgi:osmotically-inducible protein OsmY
MQSRIGSSEHLALVPARAPAPTGEPAFDLYGHGGSFSHSTRVVPAMEHGKASAPGDETISADAIIDLCCAGATGGCVRRWTGLDRCRVLSPSSEANEELGPVRPGLSLACRDTNDGETTMSERDRQNPYDRSQQQRGGTRSNESYDSPRQANQWQSEDHPQQGGYWQQDSSGRGGDDANREYRFSGQSNASYDAGYQSRSDQDRQSRSYQQERYGQGGQQSRDWQDRDQYGEQSYRGRSDNGLYDRAPGREPYDRSLQDRGPQGGATGRYGQQQQRSTPYAGRTYDASGGNDFGSFTSEDFGGRDFSNRGGVSGGMRSSESYRPTYSVSRLFDHDDDDRGTSRGSQRGYGDSRGGEERGFLQRAGDEVASWFGDESASRRREQDHRGRGPSNYTRSDERIREDANDHLTHDWGVDATHITVSVSNGELTLDGTVDSRQAKRRAEDAVEHISGVKHVQNNLRVQDRSASTGGANAYGTSGSSYGGQSGSSHGASSADQSGTSSASTASNTSGSSTTSTGSSSTGSTGSSPTGTGANTTSGIGSSAPAGVSNASSPRASDKTN